MTKRLIFTGTIAASLLALNASAADLFKIGGYQFDQANSIQSATVVEGPPFLPDFSSSRFARYSESYVLSPDKMKNEFHSFDHSKSIARLMGRRSKSGLSRHVSFPAPGDVSPLPNIHRVTIELTWQDHGLPNKAGVDFVVYEVASYEAFAVAVRKAGADEFTAYRYKFADTFDTTHNVNAVGFDLSDFGLKEGDVISAIRLRNVFNSDARGGADKVDNARGEGEIIYPGNPRYKEAHPLLAKAGGKTFNTPDLNADFVYVVGLHDVVPINSTQ